MPPVTLRYTLRTDTEAATFMLEADLPAIPAVGEQLDMHPMCGPHAVRAVSIDPETGAVTCEVDEWDWEEQLVALPVPIDMEAAEPLLWELREAGWKRTS